MGFEPSVSWWLSAESRLTADFEPAHAQNRSGYSRTAAGLTQIGVTNRIRTGTNAFTGRDAAVTS